MSGVPIDKTPPTLTLYTDAALMGWGSLSERPLCWSEEEMSLHILLEMKAVFLSLRALASPLQKQTFCIAADNSTVVAYLKNQGGGGRERSIQLSLLTRDVLLFTLKHSMMMTVKHLPGRMNILTATLCRSLKLVQTVPNIYFSSIGQTSMVSRFT